MTIEKDRFIKLTSTEIASLWNTYIYASMSACLLTHFVDTVSDPEVAELLNQNLEASQKHLNDIQELFKKEEIVQPIGFPVAKHVIRKSPKLFSDVFYLQYLIHVNKFGLVAHAGDIAMASRKDIRDLYSRFLADTLKMYDDIIQVMLQKGVYIRPPHMTYPDQVDFVEKKSFLNGWLGHTRPLLGIEVSQLFHTLLHNHIGNQVCIGFAQVTDDEEISSHFLRGKHLCSNILSDIYNILLESDVPPATNWDASVTNSTTAPFSNQLMLFILGSLSSIGNAAYGASLAVSMRRDLGLMFEKFIAKALAYGADGINIMIERGWLEQPPHYLDREKLSKEKT
ncbi:MULTISPECIES: DUF3231 family protein [unclassified Bacillus (in: firmicutes)]|uniref:DUF3231 family protein n=1 Tax=unclassified Bacillus (in: firmicutes) TaxID=185979 RepID=UPI0008E60E13|nr:MULTISPECIES: DUF3231 family protein [unclassified Bacillus (in: firmicutes)]SFB06335.1 Protein of unknown function [Bacillus sp. UNCCL13]SFQ87690.1 Protein of unknown function [Bacillus sp. cl95]